MFIADDVALAVIFYLFLNIRQTITRGDKSYGQAQGQASGPGSALQAITPLGTVVTKRLNAGLTSSLRFASWTRTFFTPRVFCYAL